MAFSSIEALIPKGGILLDVQADTLADLVRIMVESLAAAGSVADPDRLIEEILARERLTTTAIGAGCAVPHARSAVMSETRIGLARCASPIDVSTPDGVPITLIFLLAGPANTPAIHLQILSKIARFLHAESFRSGLSEASTPDAVRALLKEHEE